MTILSSAPELWRATGALKLFSANELAWSAPATMPRINGYFYNDSVNNHWLKTPKGRQNVGSNWTAFKSVVKEVGPHVCVGTYRSGIYCGYQGHVYVNATPITGSSTFQGLTQGLASEANLLAYGTKGIANCIPTNPVSDVPLGVAELINDGLPNVPGLNLLIGRRVDHQLVAGHYLNYQFAVKPLLADMERFRESYRRAEALIDDYASRANRKIRRRYEFTPDITSYANVISNPTTAGKTHVMGVGSETGIQDRMWTSNGGSGGVRTDRGTNYIRRWFSGCFTYHLPQAGRDMSNRLAREIAEMRYLYGGISASTAWNLVPFSWAADWFTNAGDVIHNMSAFAQDGLVMPWGYIMEQCDHEVTRTVVGAKIGNGLRIGDSHYGLPYTQLPSVITTTLAATSMRRRKATPYGFGLITTDISDRQWAILAALGLSWS